MWLYQCFGIELVFYLQPLYVMLVPFVLIPLFSSFVKYAICNNTAIQFKYVTWQLQAALANLPHSFFQISDEVQEEV